MGQQLYIGLYLSYPNPWLLPSDGLTKVRREEGIAGLWSGAASSLVLTINPAIQFMVYEAMKRKAQQVSGGGQLSSLAVFGVGATAKALATILTYPIQLVQAKQRVGWL